MEGALKEKVALVVGDPSVAKPWVIQSGAVSSTLTYKYDHLERMTSPKLTSFERVALLDSPYVVELPNGNMNPGTPVQLSVLSGGDNQLWQFTKSKSWSRELPRFRT